MDGLIEYTRHYEDLIKLLVEIREFFDNYDPRGYGSDVSIGFNIITGKYFVNYRRFSSAE